MILQAVEQWHCSCITLKHILCHVMTWVSAALFCNDGGVVWVGDLFQYIDIPHSMAISAVWHLICVLQLHHYYWVTTPQPKDVFKLDAGDISPCTLGKIIETNNIYYCCIWLYIKYQVADDLFSIVRLLTMFMLSHSRSSGIPVPRVTNSGRGYQCDISLWHQWNGRGMLLYRMGASGTYEKAHTLASKNLQCPHQHCLPPEHHQCQQDKCGHLLLCPA